MGTAAAVVAILPAFVMTDVSMKPALTPVDNHYVLNHDEGGDIDGYVREFALIKETKKPVWVKDFCFSACTLVLHNPMACAMRGALFGFHASRYYNKTTLEVTGVAERGTNIMWQHYPEKVKARLGALTPTQVYIKGYEILPLCK